MGPENAPAGGGVSDGREESSSIPIKEDEEMCSTKDVLSHHLKYFGERNLEGILSDYAPDAVMFTPDGPLKGVDASRVFPTASAGWPFSPEDRG
jgi:hypothetical protein